MIPSLARLYPPSNHKLDTTYPMPVRLKNLSLFIPV